MEKLYFIVDIDRCWGCKTCQTACNTEHGYKASDGWPIEVFRIENLSDRGEAVCDFLPVLCQHCDTPDCLGACPSNAIVKGEDGIVFTKEENCNGCGRCVEACGYGAVLLRKTIDGKKKAMKCDLCVERHERGFLPSCDQHCIGQAFQLCAGPEKDKMLSGYRYNWSCGQVVYVSNILRL